MAEPLCVTVTPTTFVYVAGAEEGVLVRLFNYPRFPKDRAEIERQARALAESLMWHLCQRSYSIEYPDRTDWVAREITDNTVRRNE